MFQDAIAIGLVFSVLFQETFRFLIYLLLDKADAYLKKLTETEETQIFANKHILAYVVGLVRLYLSSRKNVHCHCQGFGLMSGAFSLVNVLAASPHSRQVQRFLDLPSILRDLRSTLHCA